MPEVSADFRSFTFRLRPGIHFADDPAFKGRRRELVAEDFVYAIKRIYDPALKSPGQSSLEDEGIVGLRELRERSAREAGRFDYDRPVEGLRALDRYTLRVRLRESRPRHLYTWAARDVFGAVAREVGRGLRRRDRWTTRSAPGRSGSPNGGAARASCSSATRAIARTCYDAEPNADDAEGQALVRASAGRRLPMIDRVEIAIIEQAQPRWLSFLNGEQDFLERLPNEFVDQAVPGGKVAPNLAKRGIVGLARAGRRRRRSPSSTWTIRWSAATRPRRSRCAGRSCSATTSAARSGSRATARRSRRSRSCRRSSRATAATCAPR